MRFSLHRTYIRRTLPILFALLLLSVCSLRPFLETDIEKQSPLRHELFNSANVLFANFLPASKQTDNPVTFATPVVIGDIGLSYQLIHVAGTKTSVSDVIPLSAYLIYTQTTSSRL